jgi:hypothetical protein
MSDNKVEEPQLAVQVTQVTQPRFSETPGSLLYPWD